MCSGFAKRDLGVSLRHGVCGKTISVFKSHEGFLNVSVLVVFFLDYC